MLLQLPHELHYPIHITAVLKRPNDDIKKYTPLVQYKFRTIIEEDDEFTGEPKKVEKWYPATWESPVEGVLKRWMIKEGSVVHSGNVDLVEIEEPCPHDVQFGGMCAGCGMDMTLQDYMSFSNRARADISMAHDNLAVLVSQDEAARLEAEAEQRLLLSRKLTLVVDLDQTIIHATVDPTVAQWQANPSEVNHEVLKDVQSFSLPDTGFVPEGHKPLETWYYVKLRPGLRQFLENISMLYELHIYTMGTRAYALNVAKIVDPDGKIFGSRVLSRDESGSMTEKDLRRLFPKNTKMVVIIDDRGDVWKWSDNLIRVKPYDFFVGIGDINSSFLPKKQEFPTGPLPAVVEETTTATHPKSVEGEKDVIIRDAPSSSSSSEVAPPNAVADSTDSPPTAHADLTTLEQLVKLGAGDDKLLLEEQAHQLSDAIRAQQEARPLAKQQHILDMKDEAEGLLENGDTRSTTPSEHGGHRHRHQLIKDEYPRELEPLERNLTEVHKIFFDEYDQSLNKNVTRGRRRGRMQVLQVPDVTVLMPRMKKKTLDGVVLVFSGVIPLGANVHSSDIAIWAKSFGAIIEENLTSRVTHVIAARSRTAKVRQAARYSHIQIVTPQWLYDSISNWKQMPLEPYLIAIHPEDRNPPGALPPDLLSDPTNAPMSSEDDDDEDELADEEMDIEEDAAEVLKEGLTVDRGEMYRELEEFLADMTTDDDFDDRDRDGDGDENGEGNGSNGDGAGDGEGSNNEDEDVEDADRVEDDDTLVNGNAGGESNTESSLSQLRRRSSSQPQPQPQPQKIPRKRSRTPDDGGGTGDGYVDNDSFSSIGIAEESDDERNSVSRLAKRQKIARERHSSLRTVVTPDRDSPEAGSKPLSVSGGETANKKSEDAGSGVPSLVDSAKRGDEGDGEGEGIPRSLTTSLTTSVVVAAEDAATDGTDGTDGDDEGERDKRTKGEGRRKKTEKAAGEESASASASGSKLNIVAAEHGGGDADLFEDDDSDGDSLFEELDEEAFAAALEAELES